jgi:hypothetical protein
MDILLSQDEIAILKWLHNRATGFGDKEHAYAADRMKKEVDLSDDRYKRATSFLRAMKLLVVDRTHKDSECLILTGEGANAFRHVAKKEEWDITPEQFKHYREGGK